MPRLISSMGLLFHHITKKRILLLEHVEKNHNGNSEKCMNCENEARKEIDVTNHLEVGHS